ncbi:PAS domain-containing protein [Pseudomonas sp. R2.Fl]|nr:PAS domain-containing protein [Pseudomonas sp. R2.Fl]
MLKSPKVSGRNETEIPGEDASSASGIYTWVIPSDTLYADRLMAECFGFPGEEASAGLPLSRYLDRIHPDDLRSVVDTMRHTMATGLPCQENFRVCRPDGSVLDMAAYGACFRDAAGKPLHYSGIICPVPTAQPDTSLVGQLLMVYDAAMREGKEAAAGKIADAMAELLAEDEETPLDILRDALHSARASSRPA